jgi:alkylated DNA repair dioxygenase AlkB
MQGTYMMFGKPIKTPRLLWAMRDKNFIVPDSYSVTGNTVFSSLINSLRKKVEEYTGHKLLYAQLNYYRDGNDYIGWHTDSEVKKDDIIASISLGVPRRFVLRYKNYKTNKDIPKHEFELGNGSLLIMDYNASTKYWKHILPKMKKVTDPRINITFRNQ